MNASFEDLKELILSYNAEEIEIVTKAYELAKQLHEGQFRESGEPYIMHPVNVAYILAEMKDGTRSFTHVPLNEKCPL